MNSLRYDSLGKAELELEHLGARGPFTLGRLSEVYQALGEDARTLVSRGELSEARRYEVLMGTVQEMSNNVCIANLIPIRNLSGFALEERRSA